MNVGECFDISTQRNQLRCFYPDAFADVEAGQDQELRRGRNPKPPPVNSKNIGSTLPTRIIPNQNCLLNSPCVIILGNGVGVGGRVRRRELDRERNQMDDERCDGHEHISTSMKPTLTLTYSDAIKNTAKPAISEWMIICSPSIGDCQKSRPFACAKGNAV